MKNFESDLKELGYSESEAKVYLALCEIGPVGAGEIIKKTGIHRNIVYETLDKLINKNLASKLMRKNIAQYMASSPDNILAFQKSKLDIAQNLVPNISKLSKNKNGVVIWHGPDGFQNFSISQMENMKKDSVLYVLGSVGENWYKQMGSRLRMYLRLKRNKNITWKIVTFNKAHFKMKSRNEGLIEARFLPQSVEAPANTLVWEDKIALQTFVEPYTVIEIKNKPLSQAYLNYFNSLWDQGKKLS